MLKIFLKFAFILMVSGLIGIGCSSSGGGDDPSPNGAELIEGTAAVGAPIANTNVIIKDFQDISVTGETDADGKFSIELTNDMQPPFLLRISDGTGGYLYSITSIATSGTVNIHPYSDLVTQSLFDVENSALDAAFDALSQNGPTISGDEINTAKNAVKNIISFWLNDIGMSVESFDIISTPFDADGTDFDAILDNSTFEDIGGELKVTINDSSSAISQISTVSTDPSAGTMAISTQVTDGLSTSTTYVSETILQPEGDAVDEAVLGVNSTLNSLKTAFYNQMSSLSVDDLLPFYHSGYSHNGFNADYDAAEWVENAGEVTIDEFVVDHVISYDDANKEIVVVLYLAVDSFADSSDGYFKQQGNDWLFYGNQEEYELDVRNSSEKEYFSSYTSEEKVLRVRATSGQNIFIEGTVTGDSYIDSPMQNSYIVDDGYRLYFRDNSITSFPAAGTEFSATITTISGTSTRVARANATTDEHFDLSGPVGHTLADANLGGTLTMNWTLPQTFLIEHVGLIATIRNAIGDRIDVRCNENLSSASTTGTIDMPVQVNGQPVAAVSVRTGIEGAFGEITGVEWYFD